MFHMVLNTSLNHYDITKREKSCHRNQYAEINMLSSTTKSFQILFTIAQCLLVQPIHVYNFSIRCYSFIISARLQIEVQYSISVKPLLVVLMPFKIFSFNILHFGLDYVFFPWQFYRSLLLLNLLDLNLLLYYYYFFLFCKETLFYLQPTLHIDYNITFGQ